MAAWWFTPALAGCIGIYLVGLMFSLAMMYTRVHFLDEASAGWYYTRLSDQAKAIEKMQLAEARTNAANAFFMIASGCFMLASIITAGLIVGSALPDWLLSKLVDEL